MDFAGPDAQRNIIVGDDARVPLSNASEYEPGPRISSNLRIVHVFQSAFSGTKLGLTKSGVSRNPGGISNPRAKWVAARLLSQGLKAEASKLVTFSNCSANKGRAFR
jgi:hypothetical protein